MLMIILDSDIRNAIIKGYAGGEFQYRCPWCGGDFTSWNLEGEHGFRKMKSLSGKKEIVYKHV